MEDGESGIMFSPPYAKISFCIQDCSNAIELFQTFPLGHELTKHLFFLLLENRKGFQDIGEIVPIQAIEMGHIGIDLGPELDPVSGVPSVRETVISPLRATAIRTSRVTRSAGVKTSG